MKTLKIFLVLFLFSPLFAAAQDVYEVKFTAQMKQYRAALVLYNSGVGIMRVRYYSPGEGTVMVEQTVRAENTSYGYRLTGYNPVYPGTRVRFPYYTADNFYISQDEYGNLNITNVDDRGTLAATSIKPIKDSRSRNQFLGTFDWVLQ